MYSSSVEGCGTIQIRGISDHDVLWLDRTTIPSIDTDVGGQHSPASILTIYATDETLSGGTI